jgi:hypothetical protein
MFVEKSQWDWPNCSKKIHEVGLTKMPNMVSACRLPLTAERRDEAW